jgi:nucleotide-binding universal stress UspA family protein
MIAIKKVLVATDFSAPSETALNYARAMARAFGAELHVLHVFEPLWITSADVVGGGVALATMIQGLEDTAKKQLEEAVTEEDRRELKAVPVMMTSESPAREIAKYANDQKVDLVVIGTHGRSGLTRLLIGSVAEKIVRLAPCPVLTVHHPEHEFVMPDALQVTTKAAAPAASAAR